MVGALGFDELSLPFLIFLEKKHTLIFFNMGSVLTNYTEICNQLY